jgi:hypothetical protein
VFILEAVFVDGTVTVLAKSPANLIQHGSTTKLHQTTTEFNCGIQTCGLECQFLVARVHSLPACFGSFPSLREVVNEQEAAIIVPQSLNLGLVQQRYCWP